MQTGHPFSWKEFIKAVAAIAIPVALQNLLTTTASMVDTIMLAVIGETTVGAVGLCAQFSSLMFSCYWGFVGGGMLFFSQYWGAKDDDGIDRAYGTTLTMMTAVGLIFGGLALFAPEFIMKIYTDKAEFQEIGIVYLRIVGFGYPLQVIAMAACCLLRSTERVRIPLLASAAGVATNIILNYVLIYGNFGAPALGVRGAAIATVTSNAVNLLVMVIAARIVRYPYLFHVKRHFRWTENWIGEYLKKCFPIICNELLIGVGFFVINIVLGRQAPEAIVATAVFRTLEGLVIGFFAGFSNASSVLVGKCVGAGELRRAYERAKRLIPLCAACIFTVCLILNCAYYPILTAMGLSGDSLNIARYMLMIYGFFAVIRMSNWAMNDTYRSAGDAKTGTVYEIGFMYGMVLPAVCASGLWLKLPFLIVFACCYCDEIIRVILMYRHLLSGRWIKPVTPQGRTALPAFIRELGKRE